MALGLALSGNPPALAQQDLPGHSIKNPPDINALAARWHLAGTVIPSHRSLVITPGVANRVGTLWSLSPLLTNDFEVKFTFTAKANEPHAFQNDGFAFWYVPENATGVIAEPSVKHAHNQEELIAGTWQSAYESAGLSLLGYRSSFEGLGVFFTGGDKTAMSAEISDGKKEWRFPGADLPAPNALNFLLQNGEEHTVTIRVYPERTEVRVSNHGTIEIKKPLRPGGYIGITSYGGSKDSYNPVAERSAVVELKGLTVVNYDKGKGEESMPELVTPTPVSQEEKEDILSAYSSFKEHRDESDAIKDLTNMVFKLVVESKPQRQQMTRALESLGKRVAAMEKSFTELKEEIDKKTGHHLGEEFEAIKKELADISVVAFQENKDRHQKLENLHLDIEHVHKAASSSENIDKHLDSLSQSNAKVLDQLTNEHQRMFGVSIAAIAFIIIAGLSLYNKFRCWEKKHVL